MPTNKQLAANRANARKSTGPRTPAGKARSAQNACKHGLRAARFCLLPSEDPREFAQFAAAYHAEYCPQTATEDRYLTQLITSAWKLDRLVRLEAGLFEYACATLQRLHPGEPAPASDSPGYGRLLYRAIHCQGTERDWDRYLRHQQALERSYARVEAALRRLRQGPPLVSPEPDTAPDHVKPQPENLPNEPKLLPAPSRNKPTAVPALLLLFTLLLLTPKPAQTNPIPAPRPAILPPSKTLTYTMPAQHPLMSLGTKQRQGKTHNGRNAKRSQPPANREAAPTAPRPLTLVPSETKTTTGTKPPSEPNKPQRREGASNRHRITRPQSGHLGPRGTMQGWATAVAVDCTESRTRLSEPGQSTPPHGTASMIEREPPAASRHGPDAALAQAHGGPILLIQTSSRPNCLGPARGNWRR